MNNANYTKGKSKTLASNARHQKEKIILLWANAGAIVGMLYYCLEPRIHCAAYDDEANLFD